MSEKIELTGSAAAFAWLLAFVVRTPLDAWALWLMWGWFLRPLGLPEITFWHAMGLDTAIGLVAACMWPVPVQDDMQSMSASVWSLAKIIPILLLVGMGWVIHQIAF